MISVRFRDRSWVRHRLRVRGIINAGYNTFLNLDMPSALFSTQIICVTKYYLCVVGIVCVLPLYAKGGKISSVRMKFRVGVGPNG